MKLPSSLNSISLSESSFEVPYPPLGFCSFLEHQLGNGDTFGLYWPIGLEDSEPIVAETYHDEWSIQPHFSSLEKFLAAADSDGSDEESDDYDDDSYIDTPTIEADPQSPAACLQAARGQLKQQNVEDAIALLETAVATLPEFADAQALLCTQYRRIGQNGKAIRAAIQAIISPPCFGCSPHQILSWLSKQQQCPEDSESDPIWVNRERLTLKFGGVKENDEYNIFRDAIDQYLDRSEFIPAMTLMQTYAERMYAETVSFQERYQFNVTDYVAWQREVAATQYGKTRVLEISS